jgi:hypothetical protein
MIFLMEAKTGMETINAIVSQEDDALVGIQGGKIALPLRHKDAVAIKTLYGMSDQVHKEKLDRMCFVQLMEVYMTAVACGIVEVLKGEAPKKAMWH